MAPPWATGSASRAAARGTSTTTASPTSSSAPRGGLRRATGRRRARHSSSPGARPTSRPWHDADGARDGHIGLSRLDGRHGLTINGVAADDNTGRASGAGDLNGDGVDDLRVGSPYIDLPGITAPGQVFVIYGQASRPGIRVMPNRGLSTLGFDTAVLDGLEVRVADLPGGALGSAFGRTLTLDRDGAGHGWFLDPTPGADEEFLAGGEPLLAREGSEVRCRTDLLSVVLHELGHWLGRGHEGHGVMAEALDPGSRQLPESPPSGRPSSTTANGFARGVLFTVAPAEEALSALAVDVAQIHAKRRKRQGAG